MLDVASIPRRIARIKKLAREYYDMPDKTFIEKPLERLRLFDIRASKHGTKHPHKMKRVYISRKALKHFIERRKGELSKSHTKEETLKKIDFALEQIQEVITDFDRYEYEPEKHFYSKNYQSAGEPQIRILLEEKGDVLEVRSFHFRRG